MLALNGSRRRPSRVAVLLLASVGVANPARGEDPGPQWPAAELLGLEAFAAPEEIGSLVSSDSAYTSSSSSYYYYEDVIISPDLDDAYKEGGGGSGEVLDFKAFEFEWGDEPDNIDDVWNSFFTEASTSDKELYAIGDDDYSLLYAYEQRPSNFAGSLTYIKLANTNDVPSGNTDTRLGPFWPIPGNEDPMSVLDSTFDAPQSDYDTSAMLVMEAWLVEEKQRADAAAKIDAGNLDELQDAWVSPLFDSNPSDAADDIHRQDVWESLPFDHFPTFDLNPSDAAEKGHPGTAVGSQVGPAIANLEQALADEENLMDSLLAQISRMMGNDSDADRPRSPGTNDKAISTSQDNVETLDILIFDYAETPATGAAAANDSVSMTADEFISWQTSIFCLGMLFAVVVIIFLSCLATYRCTFSACEPAPFSIQADPVMFNQVVVPKEYMATKLAAHQLVISA